MLLSTNGVLHTENDKTTPAHNTLWLCLESILVRTWSRQRTKYLLKRSKLHINNCTKVMTEMTRTIKYGFPIKTNCNRGMIDGNTHNYNFFLGPKAQWGIRINTEETVGEKRILIRSWNKTCHPGEKRIGS